MKLSEMMKMIDESFKPGDAREETFTVGEEHIAYHIGSGDSQVLSTPSMISFMEQVAHRLIEEKLPEELISVGIAVDIRHLAPTPVNTQIQVRAVLAELQGHRFHFQVSARDPWEVIGEGKHRRSVIDQDLFERIFSNKRTSTGG